MHTDTHTQTHTASHSQSCVSACQLCFTIDEYTTQLIQLQGVFPSCFDIMCSMLFLWPFNMNIYLRIYMLWIYMQKFLSYYSIRDENDTMLEWTSLVWSHIPPTIRKCWGLDHSHPRIEIYFSTELFYLKEKGLFQAAFLCFCVFVIMKEKSSLFLCL